MADSEAVEYADLAVIDLSKMATAEGRAELAATARNAMHNIGFFYVVGHGLPHEKVSSSTKAVLISCRPMLTYFLV